MNLHWDVYFANFFPNRMIREIFSFAEAHVSKYRFLATFQEEAHWPNRNIEY